MLCGSLPCSAACVSGYRTLSSFSSNISTCMWILCTPKVHILVISPENGYNCIYPHKQVSGELAWFNHFSEGASLCEIHPVLLNINFNSLKLLRVNTRTSDRQPYSFSIIWDCKSNICLLIWPDADRINSGHWPLINMCWDHVLNTLSS